MAISDRTLSDVQKALVDKYGTNVLVLTTEQQSEAFEEGVINTVHDLDPAIDEGQLVEVYLKLLLGYSEFNDIIKAIYSNIIIPCT